MKLIATTALAVLLAFPAFAAPNCAKPEQVKDILVQKYGEEVIGQGYDAKGALIQYWGNTETGSWTITGTKNGISCILGQGGGFERLSLAPNV